MAKDKKFILKISCFSSKGEIFAAILPDNTLKVWNTNNGNLLAEWKHSDEDSDVQFSCIACSFVGTKKRRKENGTCLVALGTDSGEVFTINATNGELMWKSSGDHHGRIVALSFANQGPKVCVISTDGTTCELNSGTGELLKETKFSKKYISTSVYIFDDKILAAASSKIRVLSLEDGNELLKFSTDSGPVQLMCMLDNSNAIITSGHGDNNLQVWKNKSDTGKVSSGPVLSMRHHPLAIECKNGPSGDDLVVLSVSESGIVYIWNLKTSTKGNVDPTKIKVEASKSKTDINDGGKTKKHHNSILAAKIYSISGDDQATALIVYGLLNSPQFALVDVICSGEDIIVNASADIQENIVNNGKDQKDVRSKKRAASDADFETAGVNLDIDHADPMDGVQIDDDIGAPTMGEKLASLNIINNEDGSDKKAEMSTAKPPSADSVHVLLKQALHAEDRALLLDCLSRQNEKVITNSVALLNPSDVFKLLESLISVIQSRGSVVAFALPWLRSLLLLHASSIMSQESSLIALNSLYQLIESRVSTFNSTLQLSSCLDLLYTKTIDGVDEEEPLEPIIYEDESDDDESEEDGDAMDTDEEDNEELEAVSNVSDLEGSDGMIDY
uniref:WD repeat-containing protein 43 n=1 Tax=Erigeron canadensis TaxID=72917 RepID=UPI001CB93AEB|nr:WD repeat-containing protein 43 [Erigeron canadensis]